MCRFGTVSALEGGDGTFGDGHRCLVGDRRGISQSGSRRTGWDLVLVARRRDRLEQVAERLKDAHGVSASSSSTSTSSNPVQLEALCAESAELPLGMLVNNAALAHYMPFADAAGRTGAGARPAQRARARPAHARRPSRHGRARQRRRDQRRLAARLQRILGQALPAAARGLRGEQVVPRELHADPRRRAPRQRRARAGRLPGGRALGVPLAPGHGHERGAEDGARHARAGQPGAISSAASWSRFRDLRRTARCATSKPPRTSSCRSRGPSSCPSANLVTARAVTRPRRGQCG